MAGAGEGASRSEADVPPDADVVADWGDAEWEAWFRQEVSGGGGNFYQDNFAESWIDWLSHQERVFGIPVDDEGNPVDPETEAHRISRWTGKDFGYDEGPDGALPVRSLHERVIEAFSRLSTEEKQEFLDGWYERAVPRPDGSSTESADNQLAYRVGPPGLEVEEPTGGGQGSAIPTPPPPESTRGSWVKWASPILVGGVIVGWLVLGGGDDPGDAGSDASATSFSTDSTADSGADADPGEEQPTGTALPARQPEPADGAAPPEWDFTAITGDAEVFEAVPEPSLTAGSGREGGTIVVGGGLPDGNSITGTFLPNGDGTATWEDRVFNHGDGADSQELTDVAVADGVISGTITWTDTEGRTATAEFTLTVPQQLTDWFLMLPAAGPSAFATDAFEAGYDGSGGVVASATVVSADAGAPTAGVEVVAVLFVDGRAVAESSGTTDADGRVEFSWPDAPQGESFTAVVIYVGAHSLEQVEVQ